MQKDDGDKIGFELGMRGLKFITEITKTNSPVTNAIGNVSGVQYFITTIAQIATVKICNFIIRDPFWQ